MNHNNTLFPGTVQEVSKIKPVNTSFSYNDLHNRNLNQGLHLFDSNLTTFAKAVPANEDQNMAWIYLEFDKLYHVTQITVYLIFRTNACEGLKSDHCLENELTYKDCKNGRHQIIIDAYNTTNWKKKIHFGTLIPTDGPTRGNQTYNISKNLTFRYLNLHTNSRIISISEIIIEGTAVGKILNLTLQCKFLNMMATELALI